MLGLVATAQEPEWPRVREIEQRILDLSYPPSAEQKDAILSQIERLSHDEQLEMARILPVTWNGRFAFLALAHAKDRDVRLAVALNGWVPYEICDILESDDDECVRLCAREAGWITQPIPSAFDRTQRLKPFHRRLEDNSYIKDREVSRQEAAANSLDGLVLRTYRTIPEATADLERILSPWEDHPHVAYAGFTNAVGQVRGKHYSGTADREELGAFLSEAILRTSVLPIPTNRVRSVSWRYAGWRREMQSMSWDTDRNALPATLAPKVADLCARARARQDRIKRLLDEWKAKEPPDLGDFEGARTHAAWQERMWFLEDRYRWAAGDREFLHLRLFQHFTHNWYEPALAGLTPERRLEARLSLLRRANVPPGAMESLGDMARSEFRRETRARERELAADAARRAWLGSLAPGAPGSGWPGRLEPYAADAELAAQLTRYGLTAGWFVRDPIPGLGGPLWTDAISNTVPYLHFAPKTRDAAPVVLYFGGTGELGTDLKVQFRQPAVFRQLCSEAFQKRHPCHVVAPLCPAGSGALGPRSDLTDLLFDCLYALAREARPPMDTNRLYVTGLSWGGTAAFHLPWAYPGRFAAGIPVSAAPTARAASTNAPCSFWALYNEGEPHRDAIERRMREARDVVEAHGGELRWSTFPDAGHDAWTKAWAEPAVWDWCFSKTADGRPVPGARSAAAPAAPPRCAATRPGAPGHGPERACDGLAATWYEGDGAAAEGDALEAEFSEPRAGRLRVELRGAEAERPRCHVETSTGGRIWTRVGAVPRKTGVLTATLTSPVSRVRLVVDASSPHPLRVSVLAVE